MQKRSLSVYLTAALNRLSWMARKFRDRILSAALIVSCFFGVFFGALFEFDHNYFFCLQHAFA